MANQLYPKGKEGFLGSDIDLEVDNIVAVLVDLASYTYDAAHTYLSSIPVGMRVGTSTALTGKTITDGVFDSDDYVYTSQTGAVSEAIVLVQDTGSEATSRLISYMDSVTGLPVTPDGSNINVTVNASGWFAL